MPVLETGNVFVLDVTSFTPQNNTFMRPYKALKGLYKALKGFFEGLLMLKGSCSLLEGV